MAECLTIPINLSSTEFANIAETATGDVYTISAPSSTGISVLSSYQYFICECNVTCTSYGCGTYNSMLYCILAPNTWRRIGVGRSNSASSVFGLNLIHADSMLYLTTSSISTDISSTTHANSTGYASGSVIAIGIS